MIVLLKHLRLTYVKCLAQSLARLSEIMFSLPSLGDSNQRKVKDCGCQFHVQFGLERTFEITCLNFGSFSETVE